MDEDSKGICWAVRNRNQPDIIRIYAEEVKEHLPGVFVGRTYLGMSCVENWPGEEIKIGTREKVKFFALTVEE